MRNTVKPKMIAEEEGTALVDMSVLLASISLIALVALSGFSRDLRDLVFVESILIGGEVAGGSPLTPGEGGFGPGPCEDTCITGGGDTDVGDFY